MFLISVGIKQLTGTACLSCSARSLPEARAAAQPADARQLRAATEVQLPQRGAAAERRDVLGELGCAATDTAEPYGRHDVSTMMQHTPAQCDVLQHGAVTCYIIRRPP